MSAYKPGTYVKGEHRRVASTPAAAVQAVFDGYKLATETDLSRAELQRLAQAAGIKANQSSEILKAELAKVDEQLVVTGDDNHVEGEQEPDVSENPDAPETGGTSPLSS